MVEESGGCTVVVTVVDVITGEMRSVEVVGEIKVVGGIVDVDPSVVGDVIRGWVVVKFTEIGVVEKLSVSGCKLVENKGVLNGNVSDVSGC